MRIGIFFGGQSREREIAFAGGRTVYDNLNKAIFEPVPIFVDSFGNFILLNWEYIYKGSIRDFYPPASAVNKYCPGNSQFQVYLESLEGKAPDKSLSPKELEEVASMVGRPIAPGEFKNLFDFAFLALHGPYGEDGNIQGLLEWFNIPYSGSGILPSAIGADKIVQRHLFGHQHFQVPATHIINREDWIKTKDNADALQNLLETTIRKVGLPFVIKAPRQGSSIGISILHDRDSDDFRRNVNKSFFIYELASETWNSYSDEEKVDFLRSLIDIREGIGLPVYVEDKLIRQPQALRECLDQKANDPSAIITLTGVNGEAEVMCESLIEGKEFSCIVIQQENGEPLALPPTEIIKKSEVFDYRAKYLPGVSRKVTPIRLHHDEIEAIRNSCSQLFNHIYGNVYARIDGFITQDNRIYLNDPNTTSGMLPSSFFFHQAAEIGLNPSEFLTYIIRASLQERLKSGKQIHTLENLRNDLDQSIHQHKQSSAKKTKVAVILGGFSAERHISVESGRNIYEKLASSAKYSPVPIFLTGERTNHELYILPINILLKDNADDIKEKINQLTREEDNQTLEQLRSQGNPITQKYTETSRLQFRKIDYKELPELVDTVFIALHGRPGEDGSIQEILEHYKIPYNGSGVDTARLTINKYETNKLLKQYGIQVPRNFLVDKQTWEKDPEHEIEKIENDFLYPFIAKPTDDGCSAAVKKINNREELKAYATLIFRDMPDFPEPAAKFLKLKSSEEFPIKEYFMIEEMVSIGNAAHMLEITGGLLTHRQKNGEITYEIFEPSETLASGEVLTLEEKFLAGEGQNITPARFNPENFGKSLKVGNGASLKNSAKKAELPQNRKISAIVKKTLENVAKILQIEGYARIDAFVKIYDKNTTKKPLVEVIIIEINALPGMTPATAIFHQCGLNGYKPYNFIDKIIDFGLEKLKIQQKNESV